MSKPRAEISDWVLDWFRRTGKPGASGDKVALKAANYFEAGLIDSLGVLELIGALEKQFNIRFEYFHFQDRRFNTMDGLAEMIEEIMKGTGAKP